jgi:hypothetical protein
MFTLYFILILTCTACTEFLNGNLVSSCFKYDDAYKMVINPESNIRDRERELITTLEDYLQKNTEEYKRTKNYQTIL